MTPNETVADIAREIRAAAYIQNADTPESVIAFAARIEAAAERERAEWRRQLRNEIQINDALATVRPQFHYVGDVIAEAAKERAHEIELAKLRAPGNAAALREALEYAERWLHGMLQFCDRRTRGEEIRVPALSAFGTVDRIRAALAAPARNCDRFCKWEDAWSAWYPSAPRGIDTPSGMYDAFNTWLFDTAEGGAE